ncbi:putative beta-glucosidase L [Colletotrichum orbiculare MAFF 240422]|uniref:beta-glucosidase n=1 Tax=Colletotrichum orbiculare (strain 104-T / ATCC 96160 / CBS 514.97 / LARS 414 / MAFF 240422) TaxID=1213857 RepID=A0A484G387_COLOR|nr:putative beta-glucosidase L [Colletotrichum orbiculare MAFF 240422]
MASETLPITAALSQYPILAALAQHLSRHDMFNLGWTCRRYHSYIHESDFFFKNLTRHAPCDGRGLAQSLAFEEGSMLARLHRDFFEEPVEVRLRDNPKCDPDDTLPCVKCGTNVCEECRVYPRWPEGLSYSFGRPHLNETCTVKNVMCLCPECDRVMEEKVQGHFLDERCDCNVYTRWICYDCVELLEDTTATYYRLSTKRPTRTSRDFETKSLPDGHDDIILFWCRCGARVPQTTVPRYWSRIMPKSRAIASTPTDLLWPESSSLPLSRWEWLVKPDLVLGIRSRKVPHNPDDGRGARQLRPRLDRSLHRQHRFRPAPRHHPLLPLDGPDGVRGQVFVSTFPSDIHVGTTLDRNLSYLDGEALGAETSGGISADPYISAIGVGAITKGMQDAATIACPKHWLLNEQEYLAQFYVGIPTKARP